MDFLKASNTWTAFVDSCPLTYSSPNAPDKAEILATIVYSILIGQRRYSHITALSGDSVMADLVWRRDLSQPLMSWRQRPPRLLELQ